MLSKKGKSKLRKILRNHFGHSNLQKIRKHLKSSAKESYGCKCINIELENGVRIGYTSNSNHFCRYFISVDGVGMTNTMALTKKDYTKEGINRCIGTPSSYAF